MSTEATNAVLLAIGAQNVLLAVALWFSSRNRMASRRLALALLVIALMSLVHVFGWTGRATPPTSVLFFPFNLPLALGPLLFSHVHLLVLGKTPRHEVFHFIPAFMHFIYLTAVFLAPMGVREYWREQVHDDVIKPLLEGLLLLSLAGYAGAGILLLRRYRDWLYQARSDVDRHAAHWIRRVLITLLLTLAILVAVRVYTWTVGELEIYGLQLWMMTWSAWLGIEGWRHSGHDYPMMEIASDAKAIEAPNQDWLALGNRWRETTESKGWWREPDLSLAELAGRLSTNTNYLSRAVNEGLGLNFNAFINRMRAAEVARRIEANPNNGDLLQLALDAGFSSKATFNRAFQAAYGMTPSEFRRKS